VVSMSLRCFTTAFVLIVTFGLSGCTTPWHKKAQATPPPQAQAPASAPAAEYPPPLVTPSPEPVKEAQTPPPVPAQPTPTQPKPKNVPKKKAKPSPAIPVQQDSKSSTATQTASTAEPTGGDSASAPSPIGNLSAGDTAGSSQLRQETTDLISSSERRLRTVPHSLSSDQQTTVAQVRKFLDQAQQAVKSQDLEAAHTLATKAKLLLDELLK
jgi:outer membrane biosynthesis protein TonB